MDDRDIFEFRFGKSNMKKIIKVIGVGGGGGNAISKMFDDENRIDGVTYLLCNTDEQALDNSNVPDRIVLGPDVSLGLGAGNVPSRGREAAEQSRQDIEDRLKDGTQMVFVTAGMGGGTGTGAAPVIGRVAMDLGLLTVGIVTIPFKFEGRNKVLQALNGVQELRKNVDTILIVNNEKLIEKYGDLSLDAAFDLADDTLCRAVRSICDIIYKKGLINRDFADVKTTLKNGGVAVINTGYGSGPNRLKEAINNAINSPLLNNNNVFCAKKILMVIHSPMGENDKVSSKELTSFNEFTAKLSPEFDNIWGLYYTEEIEGDKAGVTILASGFDIETTINSIEGLEFNNKDSISDRERIKLIETENKMITDYYGDNFLTKHISKPLILSISELDDDFIIQHLEDTIALNRDISAVEDIRATRKKENIHNNNNNNTNIVSSVHVPKDEQQESEQINDENEAVIIHFD